MTIITKANSDKKGEKFVEKPLVVNDFGGTEFVNVRTGREGLNGVDMDMWLSPSARRRISASTTVCVFVTALLVMSICIIGGVYLYRQVTHHQEDSDAEIFRPHDRFKEEFELDLESGLFERIDVPDFGYGRKGRFIHDFERNKTGIIDLHSKRCFVKDLDTQHVKPPRSLFDLVSKIWMGYYKVDTSVVHQTMEVVYPPLSDVETQGPYIARFCSEYPTYLLRPTTLDEIEPRQRRSVEETQDDQTITLAEFAGQNIIEYNIIDRKAA